MTEIRKKANDPRGANLGHVLADYGGGKYPLKVKVSRSEMSFSLPEIEQYTPISVPFWLDELSGMETAFIKLPIEYLHMFAPKNFFSISFLNNYG